MYTYICIYISYICRNCVYIYIHIYSSYINIYTHTPIKKKHINKKEAMPLN